MRVGDVVITRDDLSESVNPKDLNLDMCIGCVSKAADEPEFVLKDCFTCHGFKKECEDYKPLRCIDLYENRQN